MKLSLSGKVPENTHIWLFLLIFHTSVITEGESHA